MKHKIYAVLIAATSIILSSCNWFDSGKREPSNPLIGQWKLDSLGGNGATPVFILGSSLIKDSVLTEFEFKKDTVITIAGNIRDTSLYNWNEKEKQIIPADSAYSDLQFARVNDSTISLTSKDSIVFFLQKK